MDSLKTRVLDAIMIHGSGTAAEVASRPGVGASQATVESLLENLLATHAVSRTRGGAYFVPGYAEPSPGARSAGPSRPSMYTAAEHHGVAIRIGKELIEPGRTFDNSGLMRTFGCSNSGGMRRSLKTNTLLLITHASGDREKQPYDDAWQGDTLLYTGMGMNGDQNLAFAQNATLAKSGSNGVTCLLFENPGEGQYVFVGRVVLADSPREGQQPDAAGIARRVWIFPLQIATRESVNVPPTDPQPVPSPVPERALVEPPRRTQPTPRAEPEPRQPWAWDGTVARFLDATNDELIKALEDHHKRCCGELPIASNYTAWRGTIATLHRELAELLGRYSEAGEWHLVFEYELPRERGRRPDVVLLAKGHVLVLEFKEDTRALPPYIDQVEAYARDLSEYHAASHGLDVVPLLVLPNAKTAPQTIRSVVISSGSDLAASVDAVTAAPAEPLVVKQWLESDYAPLPSLVSAARMIFNHEPLPHIRRAESAGIPETLAALSEIEQTARATDSSHLALITGVPGAGKTLVGLQYVYQTHFGDSGEPGAVFLSGNAPLVKVLQHTLRSRVFVQDVLGFLKTYGGSGSRVPHEHVWVFDEAQRAFDEDMALEKRGVAISEPEDFLRLSERLDSWALMIGLIGEGQEIHRGEEAGLGQWDEAISRMDRPWTVHCPPDVASLFAHATEVRVDSHLGLDESLRSHRAVDVHRWVAHLLDGDLAKAKSLAPGLLASGFGIYVTRQADAARQYVRMRYRDALDARYGQLASARDKSLVHYGFLNDYNYTRNLRVGPWFSDPPESKYSCCALRETATEFQCQGLELDMPIVGWGDDLLWAGSGWDIKSSRRSSLKDPRQIRLNAYRVLLTRGRDGVIVFVPPEIEFDDVHGALVRAGCVHLESITL